MGREGEVAESVVEDVDSVFEKRYKRKRRETMVNEALILCESLILNLNECSALPKSGQGILYIYIDKTMISTIDC